MLQSYDTFNTALSIGDIVVVGTHSLDAMITHSGEFYECRITDIEPIPNGPYGDILYLDKDMYGRNLRNEVIINRLGKYKANDLKAVESETETIQIFSKGVIKVTP